MDKINSRNPRVSVVINTYNQEKYIGECIQGAVNQITEFPIEILIGIDSSTDSTEAICVDYQKAFPNKIKLVKNRTDNFIRVKGQRVGRANFLNVLTKCKGEFIAKYDGDDYWTDPLKLQKQVDLLDSNADASFCFSKAELLFDTERDDHSYMHMEHYPSLITLDAYLDNYYPIPHFTKMWRTQFNPDFNSTAWKIIINHVRFFDNALHMYHLLQGPAIFLDDMTGVYRIQNQSVTQTAPKDDRWHTEEILLSHYHFTDICATELKEKFISIRARHFEKLINHSIANKLVYRTVKDILWYLSDSKSGSLKLKIESISRVIQKHIRTKNAS